MPPSPSRLLLALTDIKLAHSVFALPFALLASFIAARALDPAIHWPRFTLQLALIILCMVFARTWAMLINRLADWRFDRENARTARRIIASGRLTPREGWIVALIAAALFILSCSLFWFLYQNPWPVILALPVLAWIALYSYTKRFTWLCHLFLGGALAISPIAASIAINPAIWQLPLIPDAISILYLAGFILLWVAGFDIAYALQDLDFDRAAKLHSIPARLGVRGSLWTSRLFHTASLAFLTLAWHTNPHFNTIMLTAIIAVALLLIIEHLILTRRGIAGLPLAFFTINGIVSCILGAAGIIDLLL